jgi:exodeoxyribonuclease III
MSKGLINWLQETQPDIICLQEIKANEADIDTAAFNAIGYNCYWFSAQKKGYSGTAIISKKPLDKIIKGNGMVQGDFEGRTIQAVLGDCLLVNTYFPSGSSGEDRQAYKMEFLEEYLVWLKKQIKKYKKVIVLGDYNICHKAIDIHDPKSNANSSGFLPEERAWMDTLFSAGMVDAFRTINPHPHQYTWWSFRANARNNNKGWRIDYINVSEALRANIKDAYILPDAKHSDHCPTCLEIDL